MAILFMIGTRPEVIKLAPLFLYFKNNDLPVFLCISEQHKNMLTEELFRYGCSPDFVLRFSKQPSNLNELFSILFEELNAFFKRHTFSWIFVQGDTATVCASALAAFHAQINIAHIEAGLRTHDLAAPFPEEAYRQMVGRITTLHYAPTKIAYDDLIAEGISPKKIAVVGNTVIDSLKLRLAELTHNPTLVIPRLKTFVDHAITQKKKIFTLTAHRRESHGQPLETIFRTIKMFLEKNPDVVCIYPTHENPNVKRALLASELISPAHTVPAHLREQLYFSPPMAQHDFLYALSCSDFVVTDSGGVQEEAIALQKNIICVRDITERPEGIALGLTVLTGANQLLLEQALFNALHKKAPLAELLSSPYGSGNACEKIFNHFMSFTQIKDLTLDQKTTIPAAESVVL